MVPVVLNGVNMTRAAPPHSYIDIKDFDSVEGETTKCALNEHLLFVTESTKIAAAAKYLIKVSQDDQLFASYFWWREYYTTIKENWAEVRQAP